MVVSGQREAYYWVEWSSAHIHELLAAFPRIVLQKHLVITSFDSGPLRLSNQELSDGWSTQDALAYSPRIMNIDTIPNDQYDEWYIFAEPARITGIEIFINNITFSLRDPNERSSSHTYVGYQVSRHDVATARRDEQARFWKQLVALGAESYLAEGERLILVTRNVELYRQVIQWTLSE